jgi:hypothetical protein
LAAALGWYAIQQYLLTIRARNEAELAENVRLLEGLGALQHALEHNRKQFEALDSMLMPGRSPWEHQLDTAVWDAVSLDVPPRLHDPQLAADLAQHFAFVQQFGVLIERRTGAEQNRNPDMLGTYIRSRMRELDSHAAQLQRRVEAAVNAVTAYGYARVGVAINGPPSAAMAYKGEEPFRTARDIILGKMYGRTVGWLLTSGAVASRHDIHIGAFIRCRLAI